MDQGGAIEPAGQGWRVQWADGSVSPQACFDARVGEEAPGLEWITLEDPRARAVIDRLPTLRGWTAGGHRASGWAAGHGAGLLVAVADQFGGRWADTAPLPTRLRQRRGP